MKTKFLSFILAIGILLSMMTVSSFAEEPFTETVDFANFTLNCNSSAEVVYSDGYFTRYNKDDTYKANNVYSFTTNETEDRSGDGKSLEMWIYKGINSNFPGLSYVLNTGNEITKVLHFSTSIKLKTDNSYKGDRRIRFHSGSTVTDVLLFKNTNDIKVYSNTSTWVDTGVDWISDKWYDIDILYDVANGGIQYKIYDESKNCIYTQKYVGTKIGSVNTVDMISLMYDKAHNGLASAKQGYTYLDTFVVESLAQWPQEPYVKTDEVKETIDFDGFDLANTKDTVPDFTYGDISRYEGASAWSAYNFYEYQTNTGEDMNNDGKSLRMGIYPYDFSSSANYVTDFDKPVLRYTLKDRKVIQDVLYFTSSLKIPADSSKTYINFRMDGPEFETPITLFGVGTTGTDKNIPVLGLHNGTTFIHPTPNNTMVRLPTDEWINVEIWYDLADNVVKYNITTDDSTLFKDTYSGEADEAKAAGVYALDFAYPQTAKVLKSLYGEGTWRYMYLDNFEIDVLGSMNENVVPNLIMSDLDFTDSTNSKLTTLVPGTLNASFTANAINDASFDMLYCLAVYKNDELVAIKLDEIQIGSESDSHTVTVTVPAGADNAKAFIWDKTNLIPYFDPFEIHSAPVASVNLDN